MEVERSQALIEVRLSEAETELNTKQHTNKNNI